jgi:outer membrane receptor protein involved in Fe transport
VAIALVLAPALRPAPLLAATPRPAFDIAGLDLAEALTRFAQQSGRQLLFAPGDVQGRRASPLHGRHDPDRALMLLLRGSGLRAHRAPGGAYLLAPVPMPASSPRLGSDVAPRAPSPAPLPALATEDIIVVGTSGGGRQRQDAAFAVTSIDHAAIERLAPASTAAVLALVPGLTVETSGGKNGANIFVRGYPSGGDAEYVTFESEGVPFFPPATLSFLENSQLLRIDETVQRVEAVRGGTGALFASGQPGVTINVVQREGGSTPEALIKLTGIDDGERRGDFYVAGPIDADTRYMIGGYYSDGAGIRSPHFDADRGGQITANLRHDIHNGSVLVFARYLNDRSQWLLPIPVEQHGRDVSAYPGFDAGTGTLAGPDTRRGILGDGRRYDLDDGRGARIVNLGGNAEIDLGGGVTLRDKLSWLAGHADTTGLVSGGLPPQSASAYAASRGGTIATLIALDDGAPVSPGQPVVEAGIWTVRKRIAALVNDATIEWKTGSSKATIGFYGTHYSSRDRWNIGNDLLLSAEPHARRLDLTLTNGAIVTRDGFLSGTSFAVNARYSGEDVAFYGVEEYDVTDALRIDGGIRYQHHAVDGVLEGNDAASPGGRDDNPLTLYDNDDATLDGQYSRLRYRDGAWSWTAGANYAVTRQLGGFLRYSRGHSFPFFDNLRDGITVAPEVDTYEGGIKLSTRPASLYATLFHNRFRGLATTVITNGAPLASIGGARATGIEIEGLLRPIAGLSIAFSGTWLDAHYRHFFTDDGVTDLTGNRVQRQPVWQGRVTPAYEWRFGDRKATAFTTISYTGDRYSDVQDAQLLPGFAKWDAGVTIDLTQRLRLQIVADNIADTIGLTEANPRTLGSQGEGAIFARPIPGRSVQFSANYRF